MAAIVDLPIKLKAPADYRQMNYQALLTCLNDLNAIERFLPRDLYLTHKSIVGGLMQNQQRRACMQAYEQQIAQTEAHITALEAALDGEG